MRFSLTCIPQLMLPTECAPEEIRRFGTRMQ